MARVTLVFSALLVVLGLVGYLGTGSQHPTALIPAWFGVAMGVFGLLAMSPSAARRRLFMHINVTIGLLGLMGVAGEIIRSLTAASHAAAAATGGQVNPTALSSKVIMAGLLLLYVILCVRSFIAARRSGAA